MRKSATTKYRELRDRAAVLLRENQVLKRERMLQTVVESDRPANCAEHNERAIFWIVSGGQTLAACRFCIDKLYEELRIYFGDI